MKITMRTFADRDRAQLQGRRALECRMDAAWEAHERIAEVVYCRECLLPYDRLWMNRRSPKGHIWAAHTLTADDYHARWPGARLRCYASQARDAKYGDRETNLAKIMARAAAKYLTARQLSSCRLDAKWESRQENQDFWRKHIACRDCGFINRRSITLHLRQRHNWERSQYRRRYPNAPTTSTANAEGLRQLFRDSSTDAAVIAAQANIDRLSQELKQAKAGLAKAKAEQNAARRKSCTPEEIMDALEQSRKVPYITYRTAQQALNISEATLHRYIERGKLKKQKKGYVYSSHVLQMAERGLVESKKA